MSAESSLRCFMAWKHLLFAQGDFVVLETRRGQHFAQNAQAFIEVLGEQIQADAALGVADAGAEFAARNARRSSSSSAVFDFVPPRASR